jgi:hypothetical protein
MAPDFGRTTQKNGIAAAICYGTLYAVRQAIMQKNLFL